MRLTICAVGRLKGGPVHALVEEYRGRFDRVGRPLSLGPLTVIEVDERKGAKSLPRAVPTDALRCALDERGRTMSSTDLAAAIAGWRDAGRRDATFLIGGAEGLEPALAAEADLCLSFGPMVWPHMLVRAMLAEQLYRAASILAGTPYHRA